MTKLMKQFWIYGALPLTLLYLVNLFLVKLYISNLPNDCIFNASGCPKGYELPDSPILPPALIVTTVLLMLSTFNAFRVFKLSKTELNVKRKVVVRILVFVIPLLAAGLFLPLIDLVI
jgi:hypothetical protein